MFPLDTPEYMLSIKKNKLDIYQSMDRDILSLNKNKFFYLNIVIGLSIGIIRWIERYFKDEEEKGKENQTSFCLLLRDKLAKHVKV